MILKASIYLKRLDVDFSWNRIEARYLGRSRPEVPHFDIFLSEILRVKGNTLYAEVTVRNYSLEEVQLTFDYEISCAFEDIFTIRGENDAYSGLETSRTISASSLNSLEYESDFEKDVIENSLPSLSLKLRSGQSATASGKLRLSKAVKKEEIFKDMLSERPVRNLQLTRNVNQIGEREIGDLKMLMIPTDMAIFRAQDFHGTPPSSEETV